MKAYLTHRSSIKTCYDFDTWEIPHYVRGVTEFRFSRVTEPDHLYLTRETQILRLPARNAGLAEQQSHS